MDEEKEFQQRMKRLLPPTLYHQLIACGYSTKESFLNMRVSDETPNSITEIQQFLRDNSMLFSGEDIKKIYGLYHLCPEKFSLLPGEKTHLQYFVNQIIAENKVWRSRNDKSLKTPKRQKKSSAMEHLSVDIPDGIRQVGLEIPPSPASSSEPSPSFVRPISSASDNSTVCDSSLHFSSSASSNDGRDSHTECNEETLKGVTSLIRKYLVKNYQDVIYGRDYHVMLKTDSVSKSRYIQVKCNICQSKPIHLPSQCGKILPSNYYRHLKSCLESKNKPGAKSTKQLTLSSLFTPASKTLPKSDAHRSSSNEIPVNDLVQLNKIMHSYCEEIPDKSTGLDPLVKDSIRVPDTFPESQESPPNQSQSADEILMQLEKGYIYEEDVWESKVDNEAGPSTSPTMTSEETAKMFVPSLKRQVQKGCVSHAIGQEHYHGLKSEESRNYWSRSERTRRALSICDPVQPKIDDFFPVLDKVSSLIENNKKLQLQIKALISSGADMNRKCSETSIPAFLTRIWNNAQNNANRNRNCHDGVVQEFCTLLFIWAGPMAYRFVQSNCGCGLPSESQVRRYIKDKSERINEGELRILQLKKHLEAYKAQHIVALSEDATRIVQRIEYDPDTNRAVGFVLKLDECGIPIADSYKFVSFESMREIINTTPKSKLVYTVMAQPLDINIPPFCLLLYGTDNSYTAECILKRWNYTVCECRKMGITVVSVSADGDPKLLRAMLARSALFMNNVAGVGDFITNGNMLLSQPWFLCKSVSTPLSFQDSVHILAKLRSRLLKPSIILPMSQYVCTLSHLWDVINNFSRTEHTLKKSDLLSKDKQNYAAAERMCSEDVIRLLATVPDSEATVAYITVMKLIVESFLKVDISPVQRIKKIWTAIFFYRAWRSFLHKHETYKVTVNFITDNTYLGVEMNGHNLLLYFMYCIELNYSPAFNPLLLGSQQCESFFRAMRSLSSVFSSTVNFSLLEVMHKIKRLDIQMAIMSQGSSKERLLFPIQKKDCSSRSCKKSTKKSLSETCKIPQFQDLIAVIDEAKKEACEILKKVNLEAYLCDNPNIHRKDITAESLIDEDAIDLGLLQGDLSETSVSDEGLLEFHFDDFMSLQDIVTVHTAATKNVFRRIPGCFPSYSQESDIPLREESKFIKYNINNSDVYISKSTALWLLNEREKLSSDRLVRVAQNESEIHTARVVGIASIEREKEINIGDVAAFKSGNILLIGRILQFSYMTGRTAKEREYSSNYVIINPPPNRAIGVLCNWYAPETNGFADGVIENIKLSKWQILSHRYVNIEEYICTVPEACMYILEGNLFISTTTFSKISSFL